MNIFIFGNGNLSFSDFCQYYQLPLTPYLSNPEVHFTVCDFRGVDTLVMELLKCATKNVTVFHIGDRPRYLPDKYRTKVSSWQLKGGFESDAARDIAAINNATHFLAIDFNSNEKRQSGTARNILKCEELGKGKVYLV